MEVSITVNFRGREIGLSCADAGLKWCIWFRYALDLGTITE